MTTLMLLKIQLSESIFAYRSIARLKFQEAHKDEIQGVIRELVC